MRALGTGSFHLVAPRAGRYSLRVERIGYAPATTDTLEVGSGENVEVTIRLSVTAVRIEPLLVIERRSEIRARTEFERRLQHGRRTGLGVFITREALDSTGIPSVTGILSHVPFIQIGRDGLPKSISRGGCTPTLYLNGARIQLQQSMPGRSPIDDLLLPSSLEGIEIYRHRSELPGELAGLSGCGAIVFWTRAGDSGRGPFWRFIVGGGVLVGILLLFVTN